jgi:hypothetical protein
MTAHSGRSGSHRCRCLTSGSSSVCMDVALTDENQKKRIDGLKVSLVFARPSACGAIESNAEISSDRDVRWWQILLQKSQIARCQFSCCKKIRPTTADATRLLQQNLPGADSRTAANDVGRECALISYLWMLALTSQVYRSRFAYGPRMPLRRMPTHRRVQPDQLSVRARARYARTKGVFLHELAY